MTRTPQEVFAHHAKALAAGDLDELVFDYADDCVFVTPGVVTKGRDGVRAGFEKLLSALPDAKLEMKTQTYADDVLLLEWVAESSAGHIEGVDTFVFRDGLIRVQTVRFSVV